MIASSVQQEEQQDKRNRELETELQELRQQFEALLRSSSAMPRLNSVTSTTVLQDAAAAIESDNESWKSCHEQQPETTDGVKDQDD